jgi:hypothetical protein
MPSSSTTFSGKLWKKMDSPPILSINVFNAQKGHHQCTVIIYVDDLMITCRDELAIDSIIESLSCRFDSKLKVTSGAIHSYLGMQFDFSLADLSRLHTLLTPSLLMLKLIKTVSKKKRKKKPDLSRSS